MYIYYDISFNKISYLQYKTKRTSVLRKCMSNVKYFSVFWLYYGHHTNYIREVKWGGKLLVMLTPSGSFSHSDSVHQCSSTSLDQALACHLLSTIPFRNPMLDESLSCEIDAWGENIFLIFRIWSFGNKMRWKMLERNKKTQNLLTKTWPPLVWWAIIF